MTSTTTPAISAVLISQGRHQATRDALLALAAQTLPADQREIIVVEQRPADDAQAAPSHDMALIINTFSAQLALNYQIAPDCGLVAARNHGLALASAPLLVFLDDNIRAAPDFLQQMLLSHQHAADDSIAVIGALGLSKNSARSPLMRHVTDQGLLYPAGSQEQAMDYNALRGQPCCWRRSALAQQGLNPDFEQGGDDREAAWRLFGAASKILYNPLANCSLASTLDLQQLWHHAHHQGRADRRISELHPDASASLTTPINALSRQWQQLRPHLSSIFRSAGHLHRIALEHSAADLPMDGLATRLLLRGYDSSLAASRIAGAAGAGDLLHSVFTSPINQTH